MVALYSRVSTAAQAEEGYSIEAQQERLVSYCAAFGKTEYEFYTDGGFSGSNINRPALQRLIEDVKKRKIEQVIVFKLDRLSRSQKDTLYLIEDVFEPYNVDFVSINESFDTSTPIGKAMVGLLSVFAQLERENIYIRTREGMRKRVMNGYWKGGGNPPFGYNYNSATNELEIIPEEAEKVRQAFDMYIKGKSPNTIADLLGFKSDVVVAAMLKRPVYKGLVSFKGNEYQGKHEPIVSAEVFDTAQQKMEERSSKKTATENNVHLLSGLVFCGVCGAKYRYVNWGKGGFKLMCYSKDKSKYKAKLRKSENCDSPNVWAKEIEDIVINDLFGMTIDTSQNVMNIVNNDTLEILNNELRHKEAAISNLYLLYSKKPDDEILDMIDECKAELERIKEKIEKEETEKSKCENTYEIIEKISKVKKTWRFLTDKQKQIILRECIDKIEIYHDEINILYKFDELDISVLEEAA